MTSTHATIPPIAVLMACPQRDALNAAARGAYTAREEALADAHCGTPEEQAAAPRPTRATPAPRKPRLSAADVAEGTKVTFESDTCGRCDGKGTYPSSCWNGVCLGCNGSGKGLTAAGRAAKKAYDAWTAEHLTTAVTAVAPGMVVRASAVDPYRTVTAVGEPHINGRSRIGDGPWVDSVMVTLEFGRHGSWSLLADGTVLRAATPAEARERAAAVAHLKGATLVAPC